MTPILILAHIYHGTDSKEACYMIWDWSLDSLACIVEQIQKSHFAEPTVDSNQDFELVQLLTYLNESLLETSC